MLIEWERVRDLREEIGDADFAEVVTLFLEEADEVLAQIASSVGSSKFEADLHFLKGAALNLGFASFAAICQEGERHASTVQSENFLTQLATTYNLSKHTLLAEIGETNAA